MNDLRRLVYLQAMGIDGYVSRRQVPGAAVTRRLAVVRAAPQDIVRAEAPQGGDATAQRPQQPPIQMPRVDVPTSTPAPLKASPEDAVAPGGGQQAQRFSLAAVSCGGWLWLEELDGAAFGTVQLQLVQAMAEALQRVAAEGELEDGNHPDSVPVLTQFDWPMHTNKQLDLGREAARVSAAAFIQRKLEQAGCAGLILLGQACEERVPLDQLAVKRVARTVSTAEMLQAPLLKKRAWHDLKSVCTLA